jgi:hypothetical protein
MSNQLLSIQSALQEIGLNGYYLPASPTRHLAQLTLEIRTGHLESNHLEICEIPVPDTELFLLQWYVQLPLPEPFGADDVVPDFLQDDTRQLCAVLNQILPIGTFNLFEGKLCFRHIFVSEIITPAQTEYLVQTIESEIERCQPLLQDVAIGLCDAVHGIERIEEALQAPPADPNMNVDDKDWGSPIEDELQTEDIDQPEDEMPHDAFSIDSLAGASLRIDDNWGIEDDMIVFEDSEEESE